VIKNLKNLLKNPFIEKNLSIVHQLCPEKNYDFSTNKCRTNFIYKISRKL